MPESINPQAGQFSLSSAFKPVSLTKAVDTAQGLESNELALQSQRDESNDKAIIQQYLQSGGDFSSQEGLNKSLTDLKGKVSSSRYLNLIDAGKKMKTWATDTESKLIGLESDKIDGVVKKNDFILQNMEGAVEAYSKGVTKRLSDRGLTPETAPTTELEQAKQEAMQDFTAAKQHQLQNIQASGMQLEPHLLKQYGEMDPYATIMQIQKTKFFRDRLLSSAKARQADSMANKSDVGKVIEGIRGNPNLSTEDKQLAVDKITSVHGTTSHDLVSNLKKVLDDPEMKNNPEVQKRALDKLLAIPGRGGAGIASDYKDLKPGQKTAADTMTWDWVLNGHRPSVRSPYYEIAANQISAIAKKEGMGVDQFLMQSQDYKTRIKAKEQFERRAINIERAENTLLAELPTLENAMKRVDLSKYPRLSKWEMGALRELGDPDVTVMDQSARVILNEFQGIVTGNIGGALNVSDVEHAIQEYHSIQSPAQMTAWIKNAKDIVTRAKAANEKTRVEWMGQAERALHHRPGQGSDTFNQVPPNVEQVPVAQPAPQPRGVAQPQLPTAHAPAPQPNVGVERPTPDTVQVRPQPAEGSGASGLRYDSDRSYPVGTKMHLSSGRTAIFVGKSDDNPTGFEIIEDEDFEDDNEGSQ